MQKAEETALSIAETVDRSLRETLRTEGLELAGFVPIPVRGDRMVRSRTIEELLETFDGEKTPSERSEPAALESRTYLVHVRAAPSRQMQPQAAMKETAEASAESRKDSDLKNVRNPDGSWNIPFLTQNAELLTRAGEHLLARNIWTLLAHTGACTAKSNLGLALGFEAEGRFEDARIHFQESMAFEPSMVAARGLAGTLLKLRKDADAARVLERATSLPGVAPDLKAELARAASNAWFRAEKFELAEALAIAAIELQPKNSDFHSNLGVIRLKAGRLDEARSVLKLAIQHNPANPQAHEALALCFLEGGERKLAHDHLARSLAANISNPRALQLLVRLSFELKTFTVATRILAEYIDSQPVSASLLYCLAGLRVQLGQNDEALHVCARILGLQPGHAGATDLIRKLERSRRTTETNHSTKEMELSLNVMEDAKHGHGRHTAPG